MLLLLPLLSCSGGDDAAVEISIPGYDYNVIPAAAASCYAIEAARGTGTPPEADIDSAYIFIPRITFKRTDGAVKPITITVIKAKVIDGTGSEVEQVYAGDDLAALKTSWIGKSSSTEAAGTKEFETSCKLYLGGLSEEGPYFSTGTLEVQGYVGDDTGDEQLTAFKVSTPFNVVSQ